MVGIDVDIMNMVNCVLRYSYLEIESIVVCCMLMDEFRNAVQQDLWGTNEF